MLHREKSFVAKQGVEKTTWYLIDASGKTLGRLASTIALILRGKHKPTYTPSADFGDGVVVINAEKVKVTGSKKARKTYKEHTMYTGGFRETPYRVMLERKPTFIITHAVEGMLPKTRNGHHMHRRLRVFAGTEHEMQAQQPIKVNI